MGGEAKLEVKVFECRGFGRERLEIVIWDRFVSPIRPALHGELTDAHAGTALDESILGKSAWDWRIGGDLSRIGMEESPLWVSTTTATRYADVLRVFTASF